MRYAILLSALLAACSSRDATTPPPIVPLLAIVAGDGQVDTVGKTLPVQLGAKLTDAQSGAPLSGRVLNWVIVTGGGDVFAAVTQTGSDGIGKNSWTLGPAVGGQKLVARYIDPETGQPVTLDTAFATALPNWNLSVSITNTSAYAVLLTYTDGNGKQVTDNVSGNACRHVLYPDSVQLRAETLGPGNSWQQSAFFRPDTAGAFAVTVSGSPPIVLMDRGAAC